MLKEARKRGQLPQLDSILLDSQLSTGSAAQACPSYGANVELMRSGP